MSIVKLIVEALLNTDPSIVQITFSHLDIFLHEPNMYFEYSTYKEPRVHTEPIIHEYTKQLIPIYYEHQSSIQDQKSELILHVTPPSNENPVPKPILRIVTGPNKESVVHDKMEKEKNDLKEEISDYLKDKSNEIDIEEELNKTEKKLRRPSKSKKIKNSYSDDER
jgi:hypothetical protein